MELKGVNDDSFSEDIRSFVNSKLQKQVRYEENTSVWSSNRVGVSMSGCSEEDHCSRGGNDRHPGMNGHVSS